MARTTPRSAGSRWRDLPPLLRWYLAAVIAVTVALTAVAAASTHWRQADLVTFAVLTACGTVSVVLTPRSTYSGGGGRVSEDHSTSWTLAIAILLPPVYCGIGPAILFTTAYYFVRRGVPHRLVFTAASISLTNMLAGEVFRLFPASFAGPLPGAGSHAFTWAVAAAACALINSRVQHYLVVAALKLSDPGLRVWPLELNRDALIGVFVEVDLTVLITVLVGLSLKFVLIALPTLLLSGRFLAHPALVEKSRVDAKTGLLNLATWSAEAEAELARAARGGRPVALVLLDIDHFKRVNDTHGHLVGDRVLRAVGEALTSQSRGCDRPGRFGGEEYVLLLAQTGRADAGVIAERLREYVADLLIPADDTADAPVLQVTVSAGVTAQEPGHRHELAALLAAADSAMYAAKQAGRNRVAFASPKRPQVLAQQP